MIYSASQEKAKSQSKFDKIDFIVGSHMSDFTIDQLDGKTDKEIDFLYREIAGYIDQAKQQNEFTVRLAERKGFDQVPREIMRRTDITQSAKLVYANLVGRLYKGHDFCIPGIETIAEDCGMGAATVKRAIKQLVNKHLIVRLDRGRHSNLYKLP